MCFYINFSVTGLKYEHHVDVTHRHISCMLHKMSCDVSDIWMLCGYHVTQGVHLYCVVVYLH